MTITIPDEIYQKFKVTVPHDLRFRVHKQFGNQQFPTRKAIESYVRHYCSNYDELLHTEPALMTDEGYTVFRAFVDEIIDTKLRKWDEQMAEAGWKGLPADIDAMKEFLSEDK